MPDDFPVFNDRDLAHMTGSIVIDVIIRTVDRDKLISQTAVTGSRWSFSSFIIPHSSLPSACHIWYTDVTAPPMVRISGTGFPDHG